MLKELKDIIIAAASFISDTHQNHQIQPSLKSTQLQHSYKHKCFSRILPSPGASNKYINAIKKPYICEYSV
jgi:hypothetical protein